MIGLDLPVLDANDVEKIIPNCKVIGTPSRGGQKIVFPCLFKEKKNALKFMLIEPDLSDSGGNEESTMLDGVTARAYREVGIIDKCNNPHIIKLGNIGLNTTLYEGQYLLYFSEQWIEGADLKEALRQQVNFSFKDGLKVCTHIASAISELWKFNKIHRDIKPGNIVHDNETGNYILLDMGMAFDLEDKSLTAYGGIPGTKMYFSPEQLSPDRKRQMDFRSDLFNLGTVLYEIMTRRHPFYLSGINDIEMYRRILGFNPPVPSTINTNIPKELDEIIMRLISKKPHMRYRTCEQLIDRVNEIQEVLGV